jgi:hypothetical protein
MIRKGTVEDLPKLLTIDASRYPEDWQITLETAEKLMQYKNPYTVAETDGEVQAYYAIVPVNSLGYHKILAGLNDEAEIINHLSGLTRFNYVLSICSLPETPKELTKELLTSLEKDIRTIWALGGLVSSYAISEHGIRVLKRIGVPEIQQRDDYTLFAGY